MNQNSRWKFILNFFCNDLLRKVAAIILSVLLYMAVSQRVSPKEVQSFSDLPVRIDLPADYVMDRSESYLVKVTLRGDRKHLNELDVQGLQIHAAVSSEKVVPGRTYKLKLRPGDVEKLPSGIKVESISPDVLELDLQPITRRKFPIAARYDSLDKLPADYKIVNATFIPAEVELQGSAKQLQNIKKVYVSPIPIDEQATHSFDIRCELNIPSGLRSSHTSALAQVEIDKNFAEHNFSTVPLLIIQSAERTRKFQVTKLDPEHIAVTIHGPRGILGLMHSREISASISLDKIDKPGTYSLPVTVTVGRDNKDVRVKKFNPANARVTVVQE